ncbi:hypothetical protein ACH4YO_39175 [Streptomyces noursei]
MLVASGPLVSQALAAESQPPTPADRDAATEPKSSDAHESSRVASPDTNLGKDWKKSEDRAVTGAADAKAFKILVADEAKAYDWKTVAALSEPGMPADSWIGNQCVMDRDHVAAVYAPRAFTNKPDLMQGGAFTAIVNTKTGDVTKLPFTGTLAYFDPTCNTTTHTAAFTQYRDMNDASQVKTRVITVDTAGKTIATTGELRGQVSSAAPVKDGVVAGLGHDLVHIDGRGKTRRLAQGDSVPFDIRPMAGDRIGFVDRKGTKTAQAKVYDGHGKPRTVATGRLGGLDLVPGAQGRAFLTGHAKDVEVQGSGVTKVDAPADTDVSSHGRLAVKPVLTPGLRAGLTRIQAAGKVFDKANEPDAGVRARSGKAPGTADDDSPMTVTSTATTTGKEIKQQVASAPPPVRNGLSPALTDGTKPRTLARAAAWGPVSHDPRDTDRWCAVSRNDMSAQALQPTPNQVEWAVDMAVRGELRGKWLRQGDYRSQAGLGTIDPQGMFPLPKLNGGGRIPANVLLGILAQESNLWQAESGAVPGQMGNPLAAVDGYYGHSTKDTLLGYWRINWEKSDCGYGVGQVTDGMRLTGHEKKEETSSTDPKVQKLLAIDYASNIAASMKILADKWNEVHTDGQKITVNNDDPSRVENWFTAAWNYNLGFNPKSAASKNGGHWGLGWYNNPANPMYKKGAWDHPFMDVSLNRDNIRDAAHPQNWPYEEKVMGWAAWSIDTGFSYGTDGRQDWTGESGFTSAGFNPAWWTSIGARSRVSPPLDTFCNEKNGCDPKNPADCPDEACYRQFWWTQENATWKPDCDQSCGHENIKYQTLRSEPGRGHRLKNGEPVCGDAPKGADVVTSIPNGTETWSSCGKASSKGTFQFTFNADWDKQYEAKADLHSIGGGHGGHFWYTHTRNEDHLGGDGNRMTITGEWTAGKTYDLAAVYAYIPDTGAQTKHAKYVISGTSGGPRERLVDQDANNGKWVSLGAYKFTSTPKVTLTNYTNTGTADRDIAWNSVAFQPIKGTFVQHTVDAVAFFDEDQDIDADPTSTLTLNTPFKSRQALYDWAIKTSSAVTALPTCKAGPQSDCAMPKIKEAMAAWHKQVVEAGTDPVKHPDGKGITNWLHFANPYTDRPTSDTKPSRFETDDSAYKIRSKATVSFVKADDGKIVDGSESAQYSDRTANTHIPDFVMNAFAALKQDYGISPPNLNYTAKDLNRHDGRDTHTNTNTTGILPGRSYAAMGLKPSVAENGTCVRALYTSGGSIGYRPLLANREATDSAIAWEKEAQGNPKVNFFVGKVAAEIVHAFFNPGKIGSLYNTAPPIWQELSFQVCADGKVRPYDEDPILRSSHMPSQYLYLDNKAIDLKGDFTKSASPIIKGNFKSFSAIVDPWGNGMPYGHCKPMSRQSGNPWGLDAGDGPGANPSGHFCSWPSTEPDPEYSS